MVYNSAAQSAMWSYLNDGVETDLLEEGDYPIRRNLSEPSLSSASSSCETSSSRSLSRVGLQSNPWGGGLRKDYSGNSGSRENHHVVYETSDESSNKTFSSHSVRSDFRSGLGSFHQGALSHSGLAGVDQDMVPWAEEEPHHSSSPSRPRNLLVSLDSEHEAIPESDEEDEFCFPLSDKQMAELKARIPLDAEGNMSSIGSIKHEKGNCTPCESLLSAGNCPRGMLCKYCHLKHSPEKLSSKCRRPCRAKRVRYQKLLNMFMAQIDEDVENFDLSKIEIPQTISSDQVLKDKFLGRLRDHLQEAIERKLGKGSPATASGTAASGSGTRNAASSPAEPATWSLLSQQPAKAATNTINGQSAGHHSQGRAPLWAATEKRRTAAVPSKMSL